MNKREYEIHIIADSDNAIQFTNLNAQKIAIKDAASGEPIAFVVAHCTGQEGGVTANLQGMIDLTSLSAWHHHFYLSGL